MSLENEAKNDGRARLPLTAPALITSNYPSTLQFFQLRSPGTSGGGREDTRTLVGHPDQLFPPALPVRSQVRGLDAGCHRSAEPKQERLARWEQAARDVQPEHPSKPLRALDIIVGTVPSQVHLHFSCWLTTCLSPASWLSPPWPVPSSAGPPRSLPSSSS